MKSKLIYITQNITNIEISNIEEGNFFGNNNPNPPRVYLHTRNGINREDDKQRDCPRIIERQSSGTERRPLTRYFVRISRAITYISRWFVRVSVHRVEKKRGKGRGISVGSRAILSERDSRGLWIFGEDRWRCRTTCLSFLRFPNSSFSFSFSLLMRGSWCNVFAKIR